MNHVKIVTPGHHKEAIINLECGAQFIQQVNDIKKKKQSGGTALKSEKLKRHGNQMQRMGLDGSQFEQTNCKTIF